MNLKNSSLLLKRISFWFSLLIVLVAAIILRRAFLDIYILGSDEAIHMMWLRSLSQGYKPYTEVYITYPPLYPLVLAAVWNIWPTQLAQHWLSIGYALVGAVGVALLARKFASPMAGVTAAILTLFSPVLVVYSIAVLGEFPSVTWSVWAIWFAWLYRDAPPKQMQVKGLLVLSAICLAASVLTKVLSPFVVGLIPLILASRFWPALTKASLWANLSALWHDKKQLSAMVTDLCLWALCFSLMFLIVFWIFDLGSLFNQVVGQRLAAREAYITTTNFWSSYWSNRYSRGLSFIQEDTVLVVLAALGLILTWQRRPKEGWILLVWLLLAFIMLAIHEPIRHKHFVILIPPFAILGGLAIDRLWQEARQWRLTSTIYRTLAIIIAPLVVILYPWQVQTLLAAWQAKTSDPAVSTYRTDVLAFIEQVTAPTDCLITDDMKLVYWANRMAPPELVEVSENRLKSGALTFAALTTITDKYDCQLIAPVSETPRIPKYLPDYITWVEEKYLGQFQYGRKETLYFAKADTVPQPTSPLWANFDGQIAFHGYTLGSTTVTPGGRIPLTLIWQAQTTIDTNYKIFVQLRDAAQTTLASADHEPYLGYVPTSIWPAQAVIQEMVWLPLPADIPPGSYNIYVGLYRPDNLERLPIRNDHSGENALILGPVIVE